MVGLVKTEQLDSFSIASGTIGLVCKNDKLLGLCTVLHTDKEGRYIVEGSDYQGPIEDDMSLCRVIVEADERTYPLKFNQWDKSYKNDEINNPDKPVTFDIIKPKFKAGKYTKTCTDCLSHFLGGGSQPICQKCCDKYTTAKIIIDKNKVKQATNLKKRPRMLTPQLAKNIAILSYEMGIENKDPGEFTDWLEKQFKDADNISNS